MTPLLRQEPRRIGRPPGPPAPDRVPESLAAGTPQTLRDALATVVEPADIHGRVSDLVRYASDASPYRLVPQVVVTPRTVEQIGAVLRYCAEHGRHATFRAAGTSLCGQSQCDDVLIDVRLHWGGMVVEQGGERLRVRPGTILDHANLVLVRHGRQLGPDPASAKACTVGGAIANNAAGMRCTPERSAYATMRHATFVLPSGTVINTEDADAEKCFQAAEPALAAGLMALRAEILADPAIRTRIERKYSIRNTTGYTMRAFLDSDTPLGIFQRLLVGSEGTLAFIAEAVLDTIPIPAVIGVGWLHLPSVTDAVRAVPALKALGAEAVELLMASSLIGASARLPTAPPEWASLPVDSASLLVEFGAAKLSELSEMEAAVQIIAKESAALHPVSLSTDRAFSALSWLVRRSLNSDLARSRPVGAANVNEDVCFPVDRLDEAVTELSAMLIRYGYPPTAVSGRAGLPVWIPADVAGKCCGTIWSSKGYQVGRDYMYTRMANAVLAWTEEGTLPLVVDAASCTHALLADLPAHLEPDLRGRYLNVQVVDAVTWGKRLLDTLTVDRKLDTVTVHPGCSLTRMGLTDDLLDVAAAIAEHTHVPYGASCCGTAGDRGLLHPELVESATREERRDLPGDSAAYLAANRTCEMGLRQATGRPFDSIVFTLEERTRP